MTGQFVDFYNSLDTDPAKRGRQFEHFVKWFLKADPEWSTQVDQVWLWNEWPDRWGADCGIDLVFRHKNGEHWAVQAKCYSPDHDITKHDVDKFLSESNRPLIQGRLLIATTDGIGGNARQVCDAQGKPVVRFLLSDFERSALEFPSNIESLPQARRKPRPEPRKHQREAIAAAVQGFRTADRGQLIMACGTGKTYVTLWVKEHLAAQRTLVMVPSLGLLSQILREWTLAAATPFEVLCVCSDQTVGARGRDEALHSVADLAFPVTSDAAEVKRFLGGDGNRVVFSTYQSSAVIAAAQADASVPAFDLAVADEAHRCAGKTGSEFTAILDNAQIRSARRLFATATPRTYSRTVHKAAEDRGVEVIGMDNATLFGEVLYALPFSKAIERKLLTDYRVVIIVVDDPTIAQWIANRELVSTGTGIETDSESLAAHIGLLKAVKDYGLRRIISFHSRVSRAEAFAADIGGIMAWLGDEHRPAGTLRADFVSGNMPASKRKVKLDQLKALGAEERGVLSNARCLSEGVDVPALDGVAFIDPRSSQVDIIQAVGRAIRLSPDKSAGTIVLPVFIAAGYDAEDTIEASHFKPIWDVLNALKAHDDVLAAELDQIRTALGKNPGAGISADGLRKITIDLPATVNATFGNVLRTYLVEQVTESWNFWFGLLEAFADREGHCRVAAQFLTADGYRLGSWINRQRTIKESMTSERKARLEALPGWMWTERPSFERKQWDEWFNYLKEFVNREGHAAVPISYKTTDGFRLGNWVGVQRNKRDFMPADSKARLESLHGWSWNAREDAWEVGFRHLREFVEREGHARTSSSYKTADCYQLGSWVERQRRCKVSMSLERKAQLEALTGWTWNVLEDAWEVGFRHLKEFVEREGHAKVASKHKTTDGYRLGGWVTEQRNNIDSLTPKRKERLEALPDWSWNTLEDAWEEGFRYLAEFAGQTGHSRVSQGYKTADGYRLGQWVAVQRGNKENISPERKTRLEALPGWTWDPFLDMWELGFRHLKEFVEREGHAKVAKDHKTTDGYRLGSWVNTQRGANDSLLTDRHIRLESLPGWTWNVLEDAWEVGFRYLTEYVEREGHAKVASNHKTTDGYRLGSWVLWQRNNRNSLTPERKARLGALPDWSWNTLEDAWELGFHHLKEFVERDGHAKVAKDHKTTDGYRLGSWVIVQRRERDSMTPERKARLESMPGWSWNTHEDAWELGFHHLKEFVEREGHAKVASKHKTTDGYRLGSWVNVQRSKRDSMALERKARLEALHDWVWDDLTDRWDEGFRRLAEFAGRTGHGRVSMSYKTADGYRLGQWVAVQRRNRDSMALERKTRLESLPGWSWAPR